MELYTEDLKTISSPKINKYQSLHTAIIGPNKRPIEIQLRTMQMHEFAQRGMPHIGNTNQVKNLTH